MLKTVSSKLAAQLDMELMSPAVGYSIDQLMELAGFSVAQAATRIVPHPATVLVISGPGNNGGDGLVAARHLKLFGYSPEVWYPKVTNKPLYNGLVKQLEFLDIYCHTTPPDLNEYSLIVDSIFGFSFKPPIRDPFVSIIEQLRTTKVPILSVDIPSGWDVDNGPSENAMIPGNLISLTVPKPCARFFKGRHFVGGRFINQKFAEKYGFDAFDYPGTDQIIEL